MLSTQANIILQLISTLPAAEIEAFEKEFSKRFVSTKANSMPKKPKKNNPLDVKFLAAKILDNHQAKNIRMQVKA